MHIDQAACEAFWRAYLTQLPADHPTNEAPTSKSAPMAEIQDSQRYPPDSRGGGGAATEARAAHLWSPA